jgi:heparin binding hemagglutinin HbhA
MARTTSTDLRKPFYAAAGVGDLAVAQLRRLPEKAVELQNELLGRVAELPAKAKQVDVDAVRTTVTRTAEAAGDRAAETYGDLVERGRKVVTAIRNQAATKQLEDQVRQTSRAAKATVTTARETVNRTRTSAKATSTTAKKTATRTKTAAKGTVTSAKKATAAATKAVEAGADKVG